MEVGLQDNYKLSEKSFTILFFKRNMKKNRLNNILRFIVILLFLNSCFNENALIGAVSDNEVLLIINDEGITSSDSPNMRFWSPDFIIEEFGKLAKMGVQTLRISDEMFFLDKRYFEPLVSNLCERDYGFNMWAYSRVDTVREKYLESFKKAGINWLALGIEAANQKIRQVVSKGTFKEVNIRDIV